MEAHVQTITMLLLVAAVVAMLTRRFRLPYSVGLVVAGIVLAVVPYAPKVDLTKNLLFNALLPPLLFEAAFHLPWKELRRNFAVIGVLATLGVVLSAFLTAAGMHYIAHWQWIAALIFGVLIAATDPVSVIATFKEVKTRGRLPLLIESESLLNDGTAAVAFSVVVAIASGRHFGATQIAGRLLTTVGGGVLCGGLVALAALLLAGRTTDHLVETTMTTVAAYGSFLLADHFGFSGVLACIVAGLVVRNFPWADTISPRGKEAVQTFWEYAAFLANSFVFLLIGMHEASQNLVAVWRPAIIAIALVTLSRAAAIYPCCLLFARSSLRVSAKHQHILFWGGLRGALALALALSLSADVPQRENIIGISFAVVAFSLFAQGLTIPLLLRRMGEVPGAEQNRAGTANSDRGLSGSSARPQS